MEIHAFKLEKESRELGHNIKLFNNGKYKAIDVYIFFWWFEVHIIVWEKEN